MKIKPFAALRPPQSIVEEVECRAYDVLNSEEARKEAEGNPKSMYHINKPEINLEPGTLDTDPRVYDAALAQFEKFKALNNTLNENIIQIILTIV